MSTPGPSDPNHRASDRQPLHEQDWRPGSLLGGADEVTWSVYQQVRFTDHAESPSAARWIAEKVIRHPAHLPIAEVKRLGRTQRR